MPDAETRPPTHWPSQQLLHASTVTRPLLRGSVGHDEALHLGLVAPAPLADGRLQHADHHAVEAEHEGEQRRDRDQPEHVLVCGAERRGGAEAGAGAEPRAASWGWWAGGSAGRLRSAGLVSVLVWLWPFGLSGDLWPPPQ